ncbi:MAG: hypothetical protein K2X67_22560 [Burkholderiales bacterium]|nr:hypothetical protein [Burkholderiales bacterium]
MPAPALVEVVTSLFLTVSQLSGYAGPRELPAVHLLSATEMHEQLCHGSCGVRAFYLDGKGIFIRDDLDLLNDLKARSILLHELVHHVQHETGKFEALDACERWFAREDEAYRIQNAYLASMRSATKFVYDFMPERCRDHAPARN